jgi:hypothetical protein
MFLHPVLRSSSRLNHGVFLRRATIVPLWPNIAGKTLERAYQLISGELSHYTGE